MSGETLRAPRQQLRLLRASGLLFPANNQNLTKSLKDVPGVHASDLHWQAVAGL